MSLKTKVLLLYHSFQNLLSTETLGQHLGMFEIVSNFLIPGPYAREKGQFARKVGPLPHLIKHGTLYLGYHVTQLFNFLMNAGLFCLHTEQLVMP